MGLTGEGPRLWSYSLPLSMSRSKGLLEMMTFRTLAVLGHMLLTLKVPTQVLSRTRDFAYLVALGLVSMMLLLHDCQSCRMSRSYWDVHDRLLWRGKTCPAHIVQPDSVVLIVVSIIIVILIIPSATRCL